MDFFKIIEKYVVLKFKGFNDFDRINFNIVIEIKIFIFCGVGKKLVKIIIKYRFYKELVEFIIKVKFSR